MQAKFLCKTLVPALAVAAMAMGTAQAAPATTGLSPAFTTCQDGAQGAIERAACLSTEARQQDQRLNAAYKQLQDRLDASGKTRLQAAQRAWLQSRSRDGELEGLLYDDSQPGNLQRADIDMRRVAARADQLQSYLDLLD